MLRQLRPHALLDTTVRDLRFAIRSLTRAPLAAATIVATIALGLGAVAVLFTLLNAFLFRVDSVPDVGEMYQVEVSTADGTPVPLTRPDLDAMRTETTAFAGSYATITNIDLRIDGRVLGATLVTADFFDVIRVAPAMGQPLTGVDDGPGGRRAVVLSDKGWERHFARDPNVIGRSVLVDGTPFAVVAVMPREFRGLELTAPDLWAPLAQLGHFRPGDRGHDDTIAVEIVGRLRPGISMEHARAQVATWIANRRPRAASARADLVELEPRRGTLPQPAEVMAIFTPLFFAFGLILVIGCANVANLLLARGVARMREIGIRLSLGASRRRIVRQLMTEALLLALAAAAGGYLISRLALRVIVNWAVATLPTDLGNPNIALAVPAADWRVAAFLLAAATAATMFFALLPALRATRIDPVRTLRGQLVKDARPGRSRNGLIGIQVFASALLLICAAIFLRSAAASARFDPGFRTADTVTIDGVNEAKRRALLDAIVSSPAVSASAALQPTMMGWPYPALATTDAARTPVAYRLASPEYFDVFEIRVVRGRTFTAAERDGQHPVAIVSESVARELWPTGVALGQTVRLDHDPEVGAVPDGQPSSRVVTVVGVAKDVAGFRIMDIRATGVYLPTHVNAPGTTVAARLAGDPDLAQRTLVDRLTVIDPNMGMVVGLRSLARMETILLDGAFRISVALGGLALLLTVSGLFSVLSYLVEQRTREIGVRMALGASARSVTRLVLAQSARPVGYGLLAGAALAGALATALLVMPAGELLSQVVHVTDPVAYAGSLALITAACLMAAWVPARRAARLDPMRTLRQD